MMVGLVGESMGYNLVLFFTSIKVREKSFIIISVKNPPRKNRI
jgi:hypothetical protein